MAIIPSLRKVIRTHDLSNDDVQRYSRQMILKDFGAPGQEKLKKSSVLVVGAGGIGCPVAMYLAGAGVGHLGIVDHDVVDRSNLHRQVGHCEAKISINKALSLAETCRSLNSSTKVTPLAEQLDPQNGLRIVSQFDVVCDCSDNAPTRYLVNDACVIAKRPLVSASALRWDAMLTVLNFDGGPCYRCVFPEPPPPDTMMSCSENGVLGLVPGIIGNLQALEVVKILIGCKSVCKKMVLFDGLAGQFRYVALRSRNPSCAVCGDYPKVAQLCDYEKFCKVCATDKAINVNLLADCDRISVLALAQKAIDSCILLDCRSHEEFDIGHLENSFNLPWFKLRNLSRKELIDSLPEHYQNIEIVVICRRGNDSQQAVIHLRKTLQYENIHDLIGGLEKWNKCIDSNFPCY